MNTNAPGQLFGYTLQYPRALLRLLQAEAGDCVFIEVLGDVAVKGCDGSVVSEEDKSSLNSNPVTNKSSNLWKTFSNWIDAVKSGQLDIDSTKFILFTNIKGDLAIVNLFSEARTPAEAQGAIKQAKAKLASISKEHAAWSYFDAAVNKNEELMLKIILNFDFEVGSKTGLEEINEELDKKWVSPGNHEFLANTMLGWLITEVSTKISNKEDAIISVKDFRRKSSLLFERMRARELVDYASNLCLTDEQLAQKVDARPVYIQQLDEIEVSADAMIEAVLNFLQADVNRNRWIEMEIIDESLAVYFEKTLKVFWEARQKHHAILHKSASSVERGNLLLGDCVTRVRAH